MCDPVTIAVTTFVTSAVSGVVQYQAASEQANAQAKVEAQRTEDQNRYMSENAAAAVKAFGENAAQASIRSSQQDVADSEQARQQQLDARKAKATALASAQTGGLGLTAILSDYDRQAGNAVNTVQTNQQYRYAQEVADVDSMRAQTIDRINAVRPYIPTPVVSPSPLGLLANIGTAAVGSYTGYYNATNKKV